MNIKKKILVLYILFLPLFVRAQVSESYIIADFTENELGTMLELCNKGGFGVLIQKTPFSTYGHYLWNETFAPQGAESVTRMVATAEKAGVRLGMWTRDDAISADDAFFSSENFKQFRREAKLKLYSDHDANEITMALYRNEVFDKPSSLNLVLIDDEMVSYGTMEYSGGLALLHRCTRGAYGTRAVGHSVDAEVYKILDGPERYVVPEGELLDKVRKEFNGKRQYFPVFLRKGESGQNWIDETIRVNQVERWEQENPSVTSLGWFLVHASDKRRPSTSMEDMEWMLSKVACFHACYGLVIEPNAVTEHGMLGDLLETMSCWNRLIRADAFTERQCEILRNPYLDWHLEQQDSIHYLLFSQNFSRRFNCDLMEIDTGVLRSETWIWNADEVGRFGLRIKVDGETEIINPMVNTSRGLVMFPCTIQPGQRLLYDFGETARVVDADYHIITEVTIEGLPEFDKGGNEVYFICEVDPEAQQRPLVTLRYITREQPETITLETSPNK